VKATVDADAVHIAIIDTGRGFDPSQVKQIGLEELASQRRTGGLGMRIIRKVMDEVNYQIVPGEKNELHMVMRLKK